jgi:hypothetical protein
MKNIRTKALAWVLVFIASLTAQAVHSQQVTLDKLFKEDACHHFGKLVICPQLVPNQPDLVFTEDTFEYIKKAPPPSIDDIDAAKKARDELRAQ